MILVNSILLLQDYLIKVSRILMERQYYLVVHKYLRIYLLSVQMDRIIVSLLQGLLLNILQLLPLLIVR